MATSFKNASAAITTSRTDVFTCSTTAAVVHALFLSNIDGTNNVNATVELYDSSATTYYKVSYLVPVPAGSTLILDKPINLESGDKLTVTADANSRLTAVTSLMIIS
jgi:hypothetical protein